MSKVGIEGYKKPPAYEDAREWVMWMVRALDADYVDFLGFSVRPRGVETMMVLRGEQAEVRVVAFVFAKDFGGLMRSALHRARNGGLKWKKDKYHGTSDKQGGAR